MFRLIFSNVSTPLQISFSRTDVHGFKAMNIQNSVPGLKRFSFDITYRRATISRIIYYYCKTSSFSSINNSKVFFWTR